MNFIRSIKEFLKDPKKKSLTMFVLYFIFFVFVYIILSGSSSEPIKVDEKKEEKGIESYEYIYKITDNDKVINIFGTYSKNKEVFNIDGTNYYKENNIVYLSSNKEIQDLDFSYLNYYSYSNIEKLINESTFIVDVTYNDGSKKSTYEISIDKYNNFINQLDTTQTNLDLKVTLIVDKNKYINHITIDLQNYYGYPYNIDITYNNINNIKSLE